MAINTLPKAATPTTTAPLIPPADSDGREASFGLSESEPDPDVDAEAEGVPAVLDDDPETDPDPAASVF